MLNYRQLREWIAWAEIEPFGEKRADLRSALQTFWLRQAWVDEDRTPADFCLDLGTSAEPENEADRIMQEIFSGIQLTRISQ